MFKQGKTLGSLAHTWLTATSWLTARLAHTFGYHTSLGSLAWLTRIGVDRRNQPLCSNRGRRLAHWLLAHLSRLTPRFYVQNSLLCSKQGKTLGSLAHLAHGSLGWLAWLTPLTPLGSLIKDWCGSALFMFKQGKKIGKLKVRRI